MKEGKIMRDALVCFFVLAILSCISSPLCRADEMQENLEYYQNLWLHALETMETVWQRWMEYRETPTADDWYLGGILAYRRQQLEKASIFFQKVGSISNTPEWLRKMSSLWCQYLSGKSLDINAMADVPRFKSEFAVLLKESGSTDAWRLALSALEQAKSRKENLIPYWKNLALSSPPDSMCWREALLAALENPEENSPLWDPSIFLGLFEFVKKFGHNGWMGNLWQKRNLLSYSPKNLDVVRFSKELQKFKLTEPFPVFLKKYEPFLWEMAWLYERSGMVYKQKGDVEKGYIFCHRGLSLYEFLFTQSKRGNLYAFDSLSILRLSRTFFACDRYEDMLLYIHRSEPTPELRHLSIYLRPSLQFLSACKIMEKDVSEDTHDPDDPVDVIFFSYKDLQNLPTFLEGECNW